MCHQQWYSVLLEALVWKQTVNGTPRHPTGPEIMVSFQNLPQTHFQLNHFVPTYFTVCPIILEVCTGHNNQTIMFCDDWIMKLMFWFQDLNHRKIVNYISNTTTQIQILHLATMVFHWSKTHIHLNLKHWSRLTINSYCQDDHKVIDCKLTNLWGIAMHWEVS